MFNQLEGDGVIDNLYHLLWTKDSIFENSHQVIIPHTILYKYQKPCYWYFTSLATNQIKKKSSSKVTIAHIEEVFTRKISKSGIVAYYIYKKSGIDSKYEIDNLASNLPKFETESEAFSAGSGGAPLEKGKDANSKYVIEYFDKQKLKEFLSAKNTYPDGILQKFIDPKGEHNFIIRLHWSPKLCILEKTINTKKIFDKRFNLYERAVTYDGEEFQTETEAIRGNNLPDRFEKIGSNIASHISNITLERIKIVRMILNFKIGKNDKIYFLWCSSLRIENLLDKKYSNLHGKKDSSTASSNNKNKGKKGGESASDIPFLNSCDTVKIQVTYPNSINLFQYSNQGKPIKVYKSILCKNCDNRVEQHKMCDILFRTLVEAHDSRKRDKAYNKLFENINMTSGGVELLPYIPNKGEEQEAEKLLVLKNYKNLLMPKVIFSLYPKLSYDDYKVLKKDTVFLCKNTQVCEKCFLDLTKYCNFAGSNSENVLRVLKSKIPDDLYVRKDGNLMGLNDVNNQTASNNNVFSLGRANAIGAFNNPNVNNTFYNISNAANNSKVRSKTPAFGAGRGNYGVSNPLRSRPNLNSTTGNMGSYSNFNSKNKYKPDFSSKIKFIMQPKTDLKSDVPRGNNKSREALSLNTIGHNNSKFVSNNQPQMSFPTSAQNQDYYYNNNNNQNFNNNFDNNNNNYVNNSSSSNSPINKKNQIKSDYNSKNTKNSKNNNNNNNIIINSFGVAPSDNNFINNIRNTGNNSNDLLNKRTYSKKSSLSKKNDSEKSLNLSNNNNSKENLNNSKLSKSKISGTKHEQINNSFRNKYEESKIHDQSKNYGEEEEIDNKIKCEVLEAKNKIEENIIKDKDYNSDRDLAGLKANSNYKSEMQRQPDSESDDDDDAGHDNQSDVDELNQPDIDGEAKIGEERKNEKFEEEKI